MRHAQVWDNVAHCLLKRRATVAGSAAVPGALLGDLAAAGSRRAGRGGRADALDSEEEESESEEEEDEEEGRARAGGAAWGQARGTWGVGRLRRELLPRGGRGARAAGGAAGKAYTQLLRSLKGLECAKVAWAFAKVRRDDATKLGRAGAHTANHSVART